MFTLCDIYCSWYQNYKQSSTHTVRYGEFSCVTGYHKIFYLFLTQMRFAGKHYLITTKIDSYINRLLSTLERYSNYNLFHLVLIFPRRSWLFSNRFSGSASLSRKMGWKTVYFSFRVLKTGVRKSCKLNQLREVNEDEVSYWPKWSS